MPEMKTLTVGSTTYEIVDADARDRIAALEQGEAGGSGLTQEEKNLLLTLFSKAAYAEDDAGDAYEALQSLWHGYSVTWQGSGYSKGNSATSVGGGSTFRSTVTANTGYSIQSVTATMGGETVQGIWNNGTVTIPNVTGDIVITVTTAQATVLSISAVYTQSGTVHDTDSLDSLKSDLVVTATFNDSSTGVIAAEDYTLSGMLMAGTSTITVTYATKTTSFDVTVTGRTLLYYWDFTGETPLIDKVSSKTATEFGTVTYNSDGMTFGTETSCVVLADLSTSLLIGKDVEITLGDLLSETLAPKHQRLFTFSNSYGFICRNASHKWSIYGAVSGSNAWQESTVSQNDIANKTVKLAINSLTDIDVYLNGNLILENASCDNSSPSGNIRLGATSTSNIIVKIKSLKVYERGE